MAFTKVSAAGIETGTSLVVQNINTTGIVTASSIVATTGTFSGNVSIAGTLTYEDVTNIDSIGIVTARSGVVINSGGLLVTAGVITATSISAVNGTFSGNVSVAGTLTYEDVTNIDSIGIVTARSGIRVGAGQSISAVSGTITYYGDGSQLTGVSVGLQTEALSASAGIVTNLNLTKQDHKVTATGITTISCTGGTEGDSHTVRIVNSGIATVGFSTYFLFPSGSAPVLPTTSGAISVISFTVHRVGTAGIGTQLLAGASINFS